MCVCVWRSWKVTRDQRSARHQIWQSTKRTSPCLHAIVSQGQIASSSSRLRQYSSVEIIIKEVHGRGTPNTDALVPHFGWRGHKQCVFIHQDGGTPAAISHWLDWETQPLPVIFTQGTGGKPGHNGGPNDRVREEADAPWEIPRHQSTARNAAAVTRERIRGAVTAPRPQTTPLGSSRKRGERVSTALINYSELIHLPGASLAGFIEAPFFKTTTVRTTKGAARAVAPCKGGLCN